PISARIAVTNFSPSSSRATLRSSRSPSPDTGAPPTDGTDRAAAELYPRLLAAVAGTAVRVSVQHWCERPDELAFADVFREVFDLLAAGLPAPAR
ncbi:acyl-CoA-like ligand-binding transcription factor, partial [Streptomyces pseudogriseolus]|uniref:acyl-CoA-like ligand-binding transcription factor n=1 Tax=Streptomyces pseudogriseolus TaxID=36817 RepID=UPI003FA1D0B4